MHNYYQKEIETAPYEKIRELQNERLVKQVKRVYENVIDEERSRIEETFAKKNRFIV